MWRWTVGVTLAAAAAACAPNDALSRAPIEQGRLYTTWLYGSQFDKLWDRFSPEMRSHSLSNWLRYSQVV